ANGRYSRNPDSTKNTGTPHARAIITAPTGVWSSGRPTTSLYAWNPTTAAAASPRTASRAGKWSGRGPVLRTTTRPRDATERGRTRPRAGGETAYGSSRRDEPAERAAM